MFRNTHVTNNDLMLIGITKDIRETISQQIFHRKYIVRCVNRKTASFLA